MNNIGGRKIPDQVREQIVTDAQQCPKQRSPTEFQ